MSLHKITEMINKDILKSIIIEGQELLGELTIINREIDFEPNGRYVFVGIRQSGKSFLMYDRARQLIAEGHLLEEMVFINFDDERLQGFKSEDFSTILRAYEDLFPHRPILFLDEVQNIEGWEHFARRMANQKQRIYITGSNARMLSRDIATTLGGRFIEQRVFPFSFREYLSSKNIDPSLNWEFSKLRGEIERQLSSYFTWGGFPELQLFVNKRHWLNELYEKIILSDIILRNGIRNEDALRLTIKRLAENIKTPTSYSRLANLIKSTGTNTTVASVSDYIRYCNDACLLFELENYASKFAERNRIKKHYFVDNGLLNIFLQDSDTSLLENLCAITLYHKSFLNDGEIPYYYNKEVEIDFYLPEQSRAIQAAYSLSSTDTKEREVRALLKFNKLYGLKEAEIVTYSEEDAIESEGLTIKVVPLAKWLLSNL